jgi:hypothetical protein
VRRSLSDRVIAQTARRRWVRRRLVRWSLSDRVIAQTALALSEVIKILLLGRRRYESLGL